MSVRINPDDGADFFVDDEAFCDMELLLWNERIEDLHGYMMEAITERSVRD